MAQFSSQAQDFFPIAQGLPSFEQLFTNQFASTLASFVSSLLHDLDNEPFSPTKEAKADAAELNTSDLCVLLDCAGPVILLLNHIVLPQAQDQARRRTRFHGPRLGRDACSFRLLQGERHLDIEHSWAASVPTARARRFEEVCLGSIATCARLCRTRSAWLPPHSSVRTHRGRT